MYTLLKRVASPDRRRQARLGSVNVVLLRCSREEVVPVLAAARQHCPEEIQEIERALWQASPKGSFTVGSPWQKLWQIPHNAGSAGLYPVVKVSLKRC